jgi:hypothetical protein
VGYKDMASIIKPREGKRFSVNTFTIDSGDIITCMYCGVRPGKYARLVDTEKHECVMSNTQMEQHTNMEFIRNAHGDVLIGGLGIGMILLAIQDLPQVNSILVLEKYQEVIDLVADQLPLNDKVKIIQADIFEYEPTQKFNTIYLDIWNNANNRTIYEKEQRPLRMRYRKYLVPKKEDANRWIDCWMYKHNRDEDFSWGMY